MPLVRAWLYPVSNNVLGVTVHNTSNSTESGGPIVFSLRSSHPTYFSLLGSLLPDDVLLPGERRLFFLEVLQNCSLGKNNAQHVSVDGSLQPTGADVSLADLCLSRMSDVKGRGETASPFEHSVEAMRCAQASPTQRSVMGPVASSVYDSTSCPSNVSRRSPEFSGGSGDKQEQRVSLNEEAICASGGRYFGETQPHIVETLTSCDSYPHTGNSMCSPKGKNKESPIPSTASTVGSGKQRRFSCFSSTVKHSLTEANLLQWGSTNGRSTSNAETVKSNSMNSAVFIAKNDTGSPLISVREPDSGGEAVHQTYFLLYYRQIGKQSNCLNAATKWIRSEQSKYMLWRDKTLCVLEEQTESSSHVFSALGEPVRWLKNADATMTPTYRSRLSRKPYSHSSSRMFKESHHGSGCALLRCPLYDVNGPVGSVTGEWPSVELDGTSFFHQQGRALPASSRREAKHQSPTSSTNSNAHAAAVSHGPSFAASSVALVDDYFPSGEASLTRESSVDRQKLPFILQTKPNFSYHARTETDATVQMLDDTVCGSNCTSAGDDGEDSKPCLGSYVEKHDNAVKQSETLSSQRPGGGDRTTVRQNRRATAFSSPDPMSRGVSRRSAQTPPHGGSSLRVNPSTTMSRRFLLCSQLVSLCDFVSDIFQANGGVSHCVLNLIALFLIALEYIGTFFASLLCLFGILVEKTLHILHAVGVPLLLALSLYLLWLIFGWEEWPIV